ncbi:DUF2388 domain-containing protein [Zestomonas thermotolerans]|uniref:DUF2388 domain-containing protein n=1 Tax=Zestomonas thermotolerans TaxID=157784 RepID=UPI00035EBD15|nr:DUF2388 domain-containing protein [Pseudomonas thermotolerans]MBO2511253.1 DUF2388 domain-containing protein [Gammaproteobacteria bacterium]
MKPLRLLSAAILLATATGVSATSFVYTTDATVGALHATSEVSSDISSSLKDDKVVRAAREDAASFVASHGEIRGAQLEAALRHIRSRLPELAASDMQLAQAILAL